MLFGPIISILSIYYPLLKSMQFSQENNNQINKVNILKYWCLYTIYYQIQSIMELFFYEGIFKLAIILSFVFLLWNNFQGSVFIFDKLILGLVDTHQRKIIYALKKFEKMVGQVVGTIKQKFLSEYTANILPRMRDMVVQTIFSQSRSQAAVQEQKKEQ